MTEYMISYLPGLFWGIVGCCLGSFLDLWAQRIRREESIFVPVPTVTAAVRCWVLWN